MSSAPPARSLGDIFGRLREIELALRSGEGEEGFPEMFACPRFRGALGCLMDFAARARPFTEAEYEAAAITFLLYLAFEYEDDTAFCQTYGVCDSAAPGEDNEAAPGPRFLGETAAMELLARADRAGLSLRLGGVLLEAFILSDAEDAFAFAHARGWLRFEGFSAEEAFGLALERGVYGVLAALYLQLSAPGQARAGKALRHALRDWGPTDAHCFDYAGEVRFLRWALHPGAPWASTDPVLRVAHDAWWAAAEAEASEAGGSEAGGSEAGGSGAGGSEAGGSEAGGSEAGGSEAGGSEAGDSGAMAE